MATVQRSGDVRWNQVRERWVGPALLLLTVLSGLSLLAFMDEIPSPATTRALILLGEVLVVLTCLAGLYGLITGLSGSKDE